ncbi:MAG: FAD-dependent oxidoreductase [Bacteroidota bacterium]
MSKDQCCIIIGASHAGVNCAFQLRREGWEGEILLFEAGKDFPYHRPPLSKSCLMAEELHLNFLKPEESYQKSHINLRLGTRITAIDKVKKTVRCEQGEEYTYDKLVLATGAEAMVPPIPGLSEGAQTFVLRSAADVHKIREAIQVLDSPKVAIVGGGFIGLEVAASLRKMGVNIVLLEREGRVLSRVSSPEVSSFYEKYHSEKGVEIFCSKRISRVESKEGRHIISCEDESSYEADFLVLGTGIRPHTALAETAGIEIEHGIKVNEYLETSVADIYAIGDNSFHFNPLYQRYVRIESVPNAVDQARNAAQGICGKPTPYEEVPWFWSDQYDLKFQTAGLLNGYEESILRKEGENNFSVWYFEADQLLAVDAVNSPKAYMMGRKFIKEKAIIDKEKIRDTDLSLKNEVLKV